MPRTTHKFPKPEHKSLSTFEEIRNLRQAVQLRSDQVKLRRLEWDTQTLALPHITPMPGDGELQVRRALTDKDIPRPRPPVLPEYKPGMPHDLYQLMLNLYMDECRYEERRDPYNKLASVTAQAILEAAQEREDARLDKERAKEKRARDKKNAKATESPSQI